MMGVAHILTMVILSLSAGSLTTIEAEYKTKMACEKAIEIHREKLTSAGEIILADCTEK